MNMWWNSVETVGKINDWIKIVILIFGVMTVAASILGFVVSRRLSTLNAEETKSLQRRVDTAELAFEADEQRRAEEERVTALERQREKQRRRTPPALDAYLAFGEESQQLLVVVDAKNDIPFKCWWVVVTEKDRIVTGIQTEYVEVYPESNNKKRWTEKANIERDKIVNDYIELRFRYESLYSAELGSPQELQGKIIHKYKLVGDRAVPLE